MSYTGSIHVDYTTVMYLYDALCIFPSVADIVFIVKNLPHQHFHREEDNLVFQPQISLAMVSNVILYKHRTCKYDNVICILHFLNLFIVLHSFSCRL